MHAAYRRILLFQERLYVQILRLHFFLLGGTRISRQAEVSVKAMLQLTHGIYSSPQIIIEKGVKIKDYAILAPRNGYIRIGSHSSINPFCVILGYGGVVIGSNVRIATGSCLIAFNHNFENPNIPIARQGNNTKGIIIEDDVWLGAGVKVLDGVKIGTGSVIGANSTVTKSIPPFSVAVGSPAKVIKTRK